MELISILFVSVAAAALLCEYVDASIGMGYGTTLTPLLLIMGFEPLQVVPAVLFGQLVGGLIGGFFHHKLGNIDLDFSQDEAIKKRLRGLGYMPNSLDSKVVFILAVCGFVGALIAVFFAINISTLALKTYIAVMVLGIGITILIRRNRESRFSWTGLTAVGLLSSFNKGASGGGYGPLITGGQIISGREVKSSVGSTTLAEALVCIVAFVGYLLTNVDIYWTLAAATSIGSIIAAPFAAHTVKRVDTGKLKIAIGIVTSVLGTVILVKTFIL
ncbi:MAG: sulfite exporter TauE/SafE family protein [Euryarchaeota archaeon]|nr:sulfite exporter TauE/SafE family protein [Euryarchaeota archaeon]